MCRDMWTDECTDKLHNSCAWNTFKNLTPTTKFREVLWISITNRCERFTDWSDSSVATNFQPSKQHLVGDITLRSYSVARRKTTNTVLIQGHFMDVVDAPFRESFHQAPPCLDLMTCNVTPLSVFHITTYLRHVKLWKDYSRSAGHHIPRLT